MRQLPEGFVLPSFGDAKRATTAATTAAATASDTAAGGYSGPRKLALICSKGNLDMAYPGLILANSAAGEGIETHVFFTFWGLDIVNRRTNANLKFTAVGNTAMHLPELGYVRPGLEHRSLPQALARVPGMTKIATKMMNKQLDDLQIPRVPEFLDLLQAAGVHLYACRLTFDMMKMIEADLHPGVEAVISATDFIEISEGAQTIFV